MNPRGFVVDATRWVADHKRIAVPAAFAVLLLSNVALLYAFGPTGDVQESIKIDVDKLDAVDLPLPSVDEDRDSVADLEELLSCGTSTADNDTDDDGAPDGWECRVRRYDPVSNVHFPDPVVADASKDPDLDGLTTVEEFRAAKDPAKPCIYPTVYDSDGDGLSDGYEVKNGLDPCEANFEDDDLDGDGLTDFAEARLGTAANRTDTDYDGLGDKEEVDGLRLPNGTLVKTNPTRFSTGGSGIADGWLVAFGIDPRDPTAAFADPDKDVLNTLGEFDWSNGRLNFRVAPRFRDGLDPKTPDRDGDGILDGWEVQYALDPLSALDAAVDVDGDGLTNLEEFRAKSHPKQVDSDGDGLSDLTEVKGIVPASRLQRCVGDRPGEERPEGCDARRAKAWRSDPLKIDSDKDGLTDVAEWEGRAGGRDLCGDAPCTLDPLNPDSDLDGLTDLEEVALPLKTKRLNPLLDDTDADGVKDGAEYEFWNRTARDATAAQLDALAKWRGRGETIAQVRELLLPTGNVDGGIVGGDELENLVDGDSDADGLGDGEELTPPRENDAAGVPHVWPATNPGLFDTDGDGLDDGWEKRFTAWDEECGLWNIDPSKLNTYDGGCRPTGMSAAEAAKPDGEKDLDDDGVDYLSGYAQPIDFPFTNALEYAAAGRPDPNDADSDNDGAEDGWEFYFGQRGLPLDLRNGQDVNATARMPNGQEKAYTYARYVSSKDGAGLGARAGETPFAQHAVDCDPPCYPVGKDALHVAVWQGKSSRTYLDEFKDRTNPLVPDTDGDGLPDAWEAYWRGVALASRDTSPLATLFHPVDDDGAASDADGDRLSNLEEFRTAEYGSFLSPLAKDTDLGSLTDDQELSGTPPGNPLDPMDDAPEGDPDHDGLVNRLELDPAQDWAKTGCADRGTCLKISDPDSDRDGLLDGPDSALLSRADNPWVDDLLARGIIVLQEIACPGAACAYQFAGEGGRGTDPTKHDSDGDGMPDGYEVSGRDLGYALDPTNPADASADHDGDGVLTIDEYKLGRPATWREADDGPWWFGSSPRDADTDDDGLTDAVLLKPTSFSKTAADDLDLDNDGLIDVNGEDPFPFYDHANTGNAGDPRDAAFARAWLRAGRVSSATLDADADFVNDWTDRAKVRLKYERIDSPGDGTTIYKGGAAFIAGRAYVLHPTTGEEIGVAGVVVVANLGGDQLNATYDPARILGLGISGADGRFRIEARIASARSVTLGAVDLGNGQTLTHAVVLGARRDLAQPISWTASTGAYAPADGYAWTLWAYGVSALEGRYSLPSEIGFGTFTAQGLAGSFVQTAVSAGPADHPLGKIRVVRTNTTIAFDSARISAPNDGKFSVGGRLLDATGDPVGGKVVKLAWSGVTREVVTGPAGAFTVPDLNTGRFTTPTRDNVTATFDGGGFLAGSTGRVPVVVSFPVTIGGRVATAGLSLFAGQTLEVDVTLVDSFGVPVPGATVQARLPEAGLANTSVTNASGGARVRIPIPITATVGPQSIEVSFAGTDSHQSATRTLDDVLAIRQRVVITAAGGDRPLGRDLAIEGNLTDVGGNPVRDPDAASTIVVYVDTPGYAAPAEIDENGGFRLLVPGEVVSAVGVRPVRISFDGTAFYGSYVADISFNVTSGTRLELAAAPAYARGGDALVTGRLLDDLGRGVPRAKVVASIGGWNATAETNASGGFEAAVALPADAVTGPSTVRVAFNGSRFYEGALPVARPTNVVAATQLVVAPKTVPSGTFRVNATLLDDAGKAVPGASVRFVLRSSPVVSIAQITDSRGEALATMDAQRVAARSYALDVAYDGSLLYGPAAGRSTVIVLAKTNLTVQAPPTAIRGETFAVSGRLAEATGAPVGRAIVLATLNGTKIGSFVTGADGSFTASLLVPSGFPKAIHPLVLRFDGDAAHVAAETTVPVEVKSAVFIEVLVPGSLKVGESFTGRILLTDDVGVAVPDAILRVRFSGYHHPFTLKTNESGVASFPGRVTATGTSDLSVQFPGEEDLAGAEENTIIQVESEGFLPGGGKAWAVALVAALAILATASLMLARFRRRQFRAVAGILGDAEAHLLAGNEYVATILQAYKRLTDHFVRFGYVERADVTPQEFAAAAAAALPVRAEPLQRLIGLFEEARYSDHSIGPAQRDDALMALAALNRDLAALAKNPPPAATPRGETA